MSASYEPKLTSHLDWVRFLVGDTDVANARLDDDEIWATINSHVAQSGSDSTDGSWVRYAAAADLMGLINARWMIAGGGIAEKETSKLRIKYGVNDTGVDVIGRHVTWLRTEAATRRMRRSRLFWNL